jgi:hypothetical protein
MFVRADRLLIESNLAVKSDHVVSFYWDDFVPHLEVYVTAEGRLTEFDLSSLDVFVSESRRCIGRFDHDGYHPCPNNAIVRHFSQCRACASSWIPVQECIFEPRCKGERCDCDFCRRAHVVYAAFTGDAAKIGMTSEFRFRTRGIEQGADAIAPLVDCENRMKARDLEKRISRDLGLKQSVSSVKISKWLATPASVDEIKRSHRNLVERLKRLRIDVRDEIEILDGYPVKEVPKSPPRLVRTSGAHFGEVICMKGKFLVYREKTSGSPMMLEVADLPSRFSGRLPRK